jgi:hypothetical protein
MKNVQKLVASGGRSRAAPRRSHAAMIDTDVDEIKDNRGPHLMYTDPDAYVWSDGGSPVH